MKFNPTYITILIAVLAYLTAFAGWEFGQAAQIQSISKDVATLLDRSDIETEVNMKRDIADMKKEIVDLNEDLDLLFSWSIE